MITMNTPRQIAARGRSGKSMPPAVPTGRFDASRTIAAWPVWVGLPHGSVTGEGAELRGRPAVRDVRDVSDRLRDEQGAARREGTGARAAADPVRRARRAPAGGAG